jgi:acetyl-CoA carboxylase biotin carboxyl carrier protein
MADFDVDQTLIRKLADLLKDTGLTEIEYERGEERIRVSRSIIAPVTPAPGDGIAALMGESPAARSAEGPPKGAVTSPMVGTVYLRPEPGVPAFVKPGDRVTEGQTLLIVEAMKVMNPIPSPRAGTVSRILVSDGAPVEFGEALLVIE